MVMRFYHLVRAKKQLERLELHAKNSGVDNRSNILITKG